jgi:hypothetical protein
MTRSPQNVSAPEPANQGRQGSHLPVAGGDGAHSRYETFDGNRADVSTMETILRMVERKYSFDHFLRNTRVAEIINYIEYNPVCRGFCSKT